MSDKLSGLPTDELVDMWETLAHAPEHFRQKMYKASKARHAVANELLERGYRRSDIAKMAGMTTAAVTEMLRRRKKRARRSDNRRELAETKQALRDKEEELAMAKALEDHRPPSPI